MIHTAKDVVKVGPKYPRLNYLIKQDLATPDVGESDGIGSRRMWSTTAATRVGFLNMFDQDGYHVTRASRIADEVMHILPFAERLHTENDGQMGVWLVFLANGHFCATGIEYKNPEWQPQPEEQEKMLKFAVTETAGREPREIWATMQPTFGDAGISRPVPSPYAKFQLYDLRTVYLYFLRCLGLSDGDVSLADLVKFSSLIRLREKTIAEWGLDLTEEERQRIMTDKAGWSGYHDSSTGPYHTEMDVFRHGFYC